MPTADLTWLPVYKNTFVTATSLPVISDIHSLTHRLCHVKVPRPTALIAKVLGYETSDSQMWVAWKIWSEIGTVCETESFGKPLRLGRIRLTEVLLQTGTGKALSNTLFISTCWGARYADP